MATLQKLEDITSKEFLDQALQNATFWCQFNLPKYLHEFYNGFDYSIFRYIIDNSIISDMCLDDEEPGLIRVSTNKLRWYQQREDFFKEHPIIRYGKIGSKTTRIIGPIKIDPESGFVHEITEFIYYVIPEVFLYYL